MTRDSDGTRRAETAWVDTGASQATGLSQATPLRVDGPSGFDPSRDEGACTRCRQPNPTWFAPNDVWNYVVGGPDAKDDPGGFLCPNCFIMLAKAVGLSGAWEVAPHRRRGTRSPRHEDWKRNPPKEQVARECVAILRECGKPMNRKELLAALNARGVQLYGQDPSMVLSTMLWRQKDKVVRTPLGYVPASAIEARSDATPKSGAAEGESAVPKADAQ